jgi:hypothetical protein
MSLKTSKIAYLTFLVVYFCGSQFVFGQSPKQIVKEFYRVHFKKDCCENTTEKHLNLIKKFLTPRLYEEFKQKIVKKDAFLKENGQGKTEFENFGFEYMPEDCQTTYKIGKENIRQQKSTVKVNFYNSIKCGSGLIGTFTIELLKVKNNWRIDAVSN